VAASTVTSPVALTPGDDSIQLLCAADARYGPYAGIMVSSVLRHNPSETFHLHLLSDGVRARDSRRIAAMVRRAGSQVSVYDVRGALAEYSKPAARHLSRTAYARLLIGDLLPADLVRVLYLDCDIVCTGGIAPLWRLAAALPALGAVPDRVSEPWKGLLGLPAEAGYFNTGVLLINLDAWRQQRLGQRLCHWVAEHAERLRTDRHTIADQDAINVCLQGLITPLPECWNLQVGRTSGPLAPERLKDGVMLHYTGEHKPWWFKFQGLGAEAFREAKRRSPWRFMLPSFRWTYRLKKSLGKRLAGRRAAAVARN
jgi:lipopolysaccharide biosynthesis glycosyltransferase